MRPTEDTPINRKRHAELAEALVAAFGSRLDQLDCGPTLGVAPFWASPPTEQEQQQFAAIVSGWDWSPRTEAQQKRRDAKASLTDRSPESVRLLAALRVLYASVVETRHAYNQMRAQLIAAGLPISAPQLVNRTWEQALQAVAQQIDAEIPELNPGPTPGGL